MSDDPLAIFGWQPAADWQSAFRRLVAAPLRWSRRFRRPLTLSLLGVFLFGAACSHHSTPGPARLAILRFENLTPDVSLDWMGRAASEIIIHEISGGPTNVISAGSLHANPLAQLRPVSAPGESAERDAALAEGATRLVIGQFSLSRGRLSLAITERDTASGKTVQSFTLTAPDPADLSALADTAAHRLSPGAAPFDSRSNAAIASWGRALEETDYTKSSDEYARAVQADPGFADAWLAWAGSASSHGDRAASEKILSEALRHADRFSNLNRARLKLAAVQLTGDRAATLAAMNELGRLLPDDADNVRAIAGQNYAARQFQTAASAYRRLTRINPNDQDAWNQLGYALAYAGDYNGAISAFQTYQHLAPDNPNPLDSQGDAAFVFGRFSDAEKLYQQAAAKDPAFDNSGDLYKAAEARLMTGDVAGADTKFDAYAAARRAANDSSLPFHTAHWRFRSGRHDQAWSSLSKIASDPQLKTPQLRSLVLTQMAIWDLELGRRDRALQESGDALKTGAASPATLIARFASEDAHTAADWSARADRLLGAPQMAQLKPVALAYALYLGQQWQAAEPLWKQILDRSTPDDTVTPVIYARILVELHRPRDAEPFVRLFPLPKPNGSQDFLSLAMPRIFDVRAAVLASQAKNAEAQASRKVFQTLWGEK